MKPPFFATRAHVLVCTGPNCTRRGADLLFKALWAGLEREKLAYYTAGSLRLTESGCLGSCQFGPSLTCYFRRPLQPGSLGEAWYAGVTYPGAMALARALHEGAALPDEGRYDR